MMSFTTSSASEPREAPFYNPLADSNEIRVLELQPRRDDDVIKCTLKHIDIRDQTFEALSYMWGPENTAPIEINGKLHHVRENLWLALKQLAPKWPSQEAKFLWIGAICINQDDISEKSHQVAQMGEIYSMASRVLVWLGPGDADNSAAIRWMHDELNQRKGSPSKPCGFVVNTNVEDKLRSVRSLLGREYWTRLWIIQEFLAAYAIVLHCGEENIKWGTLKTFLDVVDYYMENFMSSQEIMVILYIRHFIRKSVCLGNSASIETLTQAEAANP